MSNLNNILKGIKNNPSKQIISLRIQKWLCAHPEGVVTSPDELKVIERLLSKPPTINRGGSLHSRPGCQRWEIFTYAGWEGKPVFDPYLYNRFNDGSFRHLRWQLMGLLAGVFEDVEVRRHNQELRLSTSADAVNWTEKFGFELKGTSYINAILEKGVPEEHLQQISRNLVNFPELDFWIYLAEDKRTQSWREIVVPREKKREAKTLNEIKILNDFIDCEVLPPILEGCKTKRGVEYHGCPFSDRCLSQETWPIVPKSKGKKAGGRRRKKLPHHI